MLIISEIQVRFQKFQLCWAQKPEIFPLQNFMNFGEGQMKNPHFSGSPDKEWPIYNVSESSKSRMGLQFGHP